MTYKHHRSGRVFCAATFTKDCIKSKSSSMSIVLTLLTSTLSRVFPSSLSLYSLQSISRSHQCTPFYVKFVVELLVNGTLDWHLLGHDLFHDFLDRDLQRHAKPCYCISYVIFKQKRINLSPNAASSQLIASCGHVCIDCTSRVVKPF